MKNLKQKLLVTTLVLAGCISIDSNADIVSAGSAIQNQQAIAGRYEFIVSTHQCFVSNPTASTIRYRIEYRTCAMGDCSMETIYKDILPGASWNDYRQNKVWAYFPYKGQIRSSAETYVYGPYTSRVINYGTVQVD